MTNKAKEKFWLLKIKQVAKNEGWKFKGNFIFKAVDELYFSSHFYVNGKTNELSGWLDYKTINIDNVFWDIIDEQPNKKMPFSFRGEAAFCVRPINYFHFNVVINDLFNPEPQVEQLLQKINFKVTEKSKAIRTIDDFRSDMLREEKSNTVGIVTSFIAQGQFKQALSKVKEYRANQFPSGFRFGKNEFYDLATEYCKKNYR